MSDCEQSSEEDFREGEGPVRSYMFTWAQTNQSTLRHISSLIISESGYRFVRLSIFGDKIYAFLAV